MNKEICPECGTEARKISHRPVENFLRDSSTLSGEVYGLCMSETCQVTYFNRETGEVYYQKDLLWPIWFKEGASPKYICYCGKVEEKAIIDAVLNKGARDMKDIIRLTPAMKNSNCSKNNPLGKCCGSEIEKTIEKALKLKETIDS